MRGCCVAREMPHLILIRTGGFHRCPFEGKDYYRQGKPPLFLSLLPPSFSLPIRTFFLLGTLQSFVYPENSHRHPSFPHSLPLPLPPFLRSSYLFNPNALAPRWPIGCASSATWRPLSFTEGSLQRVNILSPSLPPSLASCFPFSISLLIIFQILRQMMFIFFLPPYGLFFLSLRLYLIDSTPSFPLSFPPLALLRHPLLLPPSRRARHIFRGFHPGPTERAGCHRCPLQGDRRGR